MIREFGNSVLFPETGFEISSNRVLRGIEIHDELNRNHSSKLGCANRIGYTGNV